MLCIFLFKKVSSKQYWHTYRQHWSCGTQTTSIFHVCLHRSRLVKYVNITSRGTAGSELTLESIKHVIIVDKVRWGQYSTCLTHFSPTIPYSYSNNHLTNVYLYTIITRALSRRPIWSHGHESNQVCDAWWAGRSCPLITALEKRWRLL